MLRAIIVAGVVSACSSEKPDRTKPDPAKPPAPEVWMGRLIRPARPCIERFRGRMPDPYLTQVSLTSKDGLIALSFESGEQAEFNACVVEAVTGAHISADGLDRPVVVPFAFSFANPAAN
ncbi:MAG TPA: hypothetical protein VF403_18285 [Kofleriaceae bacterium]